MNATETPTSSSTATRKRILDDKRRERVDVQARQVAAQKTLAAAQKKLDAAGYQALLREVTAARDAAARADDEADSLDGRTERRLRDALTDAEKSALDACWRKLNVEGERLMNAGPRDDAGKAKQAGRMAEIRAARERLQGVALTDDDVIRLCAEIAAALDLD